jgi:hypothetical protein
MASMPFAIDGRERLTMQNESQKVVAQTSSAARELFRHARIYLGMNCVLVSPGLSIVTTALF